MYFASREDAGKNLAEEIAKKHGGSDCAVVALSDGGVVIGAQIALKLHAVITMLLSEPITLPRENDAIGGISQDGSFAYNSMYSPGEIEELLMEYRSYIEEEKFSKLAQTHRLLSMGGVIKKSLLRGKNIILVSDGLASGFSLDVAVEFMKTIATKKLIVATPIASVSAVDRMHILADEIYCSSVVGDYISTDHYYDHQDIPSHDRVVKAIEQIMNHWK